jgi:F-type H+-transporting ATPase subunit gamma
MPSLKEVRNKIVSVRNMQKITKAMKVVSAAKLRKAQQRIVQMRPYAGKLQELLSHLSGSLEGEATKFYENRPVKKVLVVAITSDSGLAGSFNSVVIKDAVRMITKEYATQHETKDVDVLAVGKKSTAFFKKNNYNVIQEHTTIFKNLTYDSAEEIANYVIKLFLDKGYDAVDVVYNRFKNAAVYIPTVERFLPIPFEKHEEKKDANKADASGHHYIPDYIFEPSQEEIVGKLINQSLRLNFFRTLLESNAAEHGARMTAMDKASENAEDLLGQYKLAYNKARQATITKEILEIVSGAAALGS